MKHYLLLAFLFLTVPSLAVGQEMTFIDLKRPVGFAFGSFQDHSIVDGGDLHLTAATGQGGVGWTRKFSAEKHRDDSPVLVVQRGEKHAATKLVLKIKDASEQERVFEFDLTPLTPNEESVVYPIGSSPLSTSVTGSDDEPFDPARIVSCLLMGNWQKERFDLMVSAIELRPPTQEHLQQRAEQMAVIQAERERQRLMDQQLRELRQRIVKEGAEHPADGPQVTAIAALSPTMLAVRIEQQSIAHGGQRAYVSQPGDKAISEGKKVLAWHDGEPAEVSSSQKLRRQQPDSQQQREIGKLLADGKTLWVDNTLEGVELTPETIIVPLAYRLQSRDDFKYAQPVSPVEVFHKAKPVGRSDRGGAVEHWIYLRFEHPLTQGQEYSIEFHAINTRDAESQFVFDSSKMWSPAIEVSQVGYRPSDPFKQAILSQWLGTGGAYAFDATTFELLDKSGKSVFQGDVKQVLAADETENLIGGKNRTGTNVYAMDFGSFSQAGSYQVHVPGVGVSYPVTISDEVWREAFSCVAKGLLAHRSGIELPQSLLGYERPRPMHPDDGLVVFQTEVIRWDGESKAIHDSLKRQLGKPMETSQLQRVDNAWGGYMDAGDWDRRAQHLWVSYRLLELYAMFPEYFDDLKLTVPVDEVTNQIPDVLDEVDWNVAFYQRIQREDGAIRGGVESTEHPRTGEASWQESLLVGAFDPDPEASYLFAATAAKLAGALRSSDTELATKYRRSAIAAWDWSMRDGDVVIEAAKLRGVKDADKLDSRVSDVQSLAAIELYRLTGDKKYHDVFESALTLTNTGIGDSSLDVAFAYATLPKPLADATIGQRAEAAVIAAADLTLKFGDGNAYGISHRVSNLPMLGFVAYYSVPESVLGPTLPRAHYLTSETKYLAGALRATNYAVGANPMNMTMTTGLGQVSPRYPLHVDSHATGQQPPPGIVVYGSHDPTRAPGYIKQWSLRGKLVPEDVGSWPAAESYLDIGNWVEMNEYTVTQTIGPTAYYWGYLAARN